MAEIEVIQPALLEIESSQVVPENCYGEGNGSISIIVSGGPLDVILGDFSPYTYATIIYGR